MARLAFLEEIGFFGDPDPLPERVPTGGDFGDTFILKKIVRRNAGESINLMQVNLQVYLCASCT